jgi:GNAT superfamily N-acetyltransferase
MFEIIKGNESFASKIINRDSDMQFAGVAIGNNNGQVWTDSAEEPTLAVIWSEGIKGFQFMGSANNTEFNNQLKDFIEIELLDFLKAKGLDCLEYASDSEEWYPVIANAIAGREIEESYQYVFRPDASQVEAEEKALPKSYSIYQIDKCFVESIENNEMFSNTEFLINYIKLFWGSVEKFIDVGYGYAAVEGDQIVSFAITSLLFRKTFSIGIETLKEHRRKGLASCLTKKLVKALYEKGYDIWWDCMESNIASQGTAKNAGLVFDHKYKLCEFYF